MHHRHLLAHHPRERQIAAQPRGPRLFRAAVKCLGDGSQQIESADDAHQLPGRVDDRQPLEALVRHHVGDGGDRRALDDRDRIRRHHLARCLAAELVQGRGAFRIGEAAEQLDADQQSAALDQVEVGDHSDRPPVFDDRHRAVDLALDELDDLAQRTLRRHGDHVARHHLLDGHRVRQGPHAVGLVEENLGILRGDQSAADHLLQLR